MEGYTYIKYDNAKTYVTFEEQFDEAYYNNIGTTWDDYTKNKWVLLSDEQVAFHEAHPELPVWNVWSMTVPTPTERTLERAKNEMYRTIDTYDNSNNVNGFIVKFASDSEEAVDGYISVNTWFTPIERSNHRSSIDSAKLLNVENVSLYIAGRQVTLPTASAEIMLAQIQLYADQCFMVTEQHKADVSELQTIADVDAYAYNAGYPEMLTFTVE